MQVRHSLDFLTSSSSLPLSSLEIAETEGTVVLSQIPSLINRSLHIKKSAVIMIVMVIPYICHFFTRAKFLEIENLHRKTPIFCVKSVKKTPIFRFKSTKNLHRPGHVNLVLWVTHSQGRLVWGPPLETLHFLDQTFMVFVWFLWVLK